MAWTLSCLNLRKHYNEVILYTDSNGCKVLREDVLLPHRLNTITESADLFAQNKETSSDYYHNMMNDILRHNLRLPYFF